ncbi:MAG: glycoside hydrolase family 108 protein [Rhodobacteraceae bacterium]|nr:glycoside hydrolase family 108 protein [Paracoccaceae bacterium]
MARGNFEACMAEIFKHEGGFVNHPRDPGGATNMGITIGTLRGWRSGPVTVEDVRTLTKREAKTIYRARYWNPVKGDDLPVGLDLVTFDPAVNSGNSRGARWLQQALGGVSVDGKVGPQTLGAARKAEPVPVIKRACAKRMGFLRGLRTWDAFGRGWSRRVASVEAVSVAMAVAAAGAPARPALVAEQDSAQGKAEREGQAAGGTAVAGGGAGGGAATLADLPVWGLAGLAVAVLVIIALLLGQRRHDLDRAAAYQAAALEAGT